MTTLIETVPATAKLAATLVAIVSLMRLKIPMGAALIAGAVLLAVLFPMTPGAFLAAALDGLLSETAIFLVITVVAILVFSNALSAVKQIDRIIAAFRALVGESRIALVAFPALIGLLPMPGGAVFSAPMVDAAAGTADVSKEQRAIANYWFRHIWEYWFPFYPGVILVLTMTGVSTIRFIALQIPLALLAVGAGYLFILHRIRLGGTKGHFSLGNARRFTAELSPILLVVAAVAILDPLAGALTAAYGIDSMLVRRLPVLCGLLLGGAWLFTKRGLTWRTLGQLTCSKHVATMAFLAVGIMLFKGVLEGSGAVTALQAEFKQWQVPLLAVICLLPFITGLVVGIAIGYVGASFPLILLLLEGIPEDQRLPYYCLAYSFGYVGMMASPVHLCLVLTNEYFQASLARVYRYLVPLCLIMAIFSLLLFLVYRTL